MTLGTWGNWGMAVGLLLAVAAPASAQENLDQNKSPAQLFASDCSICHKSPNGLGKAGGLFGLDSFLRVHYTASRETADRLAKYLQTFANAPEPGAKQSKRPARGADKEKSKPAEAKAGTKADPRKETKETPTAESKPDAKPEAKSETKPESKPEAKAEAAPEPKAEPKPEAKPETKPEAKPEKSD